jgi:secreted trypsin-like serine protease
VVGEHKLGTDIDCGNTGCTKAVQRIKVLKVILHENLSKLMDGNDIALVRLQEPISTVRSLLCPSYFF